MSELGAKAFQQRQWRGRLKRSRLPIPFVVVTTSVGLRQIRSVTTVQVKADVKKSGVRLVWSKAQKSGWKNRSTHSVIPSNYDCFGEGLPQEDQEERTRFSGSQCAQ